MARLSARNLIPTRFYPQTVCYNPGAPANPHLGGSFLLATETAKPVLVLQTATGPAVMISGVGLLLPAMTSRLARVVDHAAIRPEVGEDWEA